MTRVSLLEVLNNPVVEESAIAILEQPEMSEEVENLAEEILGNVGNGRFTTAVIVLACLRVIDMIGEILAERSEVVC